MRHKNLVVTALLATAVAAAGTQTARAAGLLTAEGQWGSSQLAIKEHTVHVTINNGIAVTHVDQIFLNGEDRQVEALYSFPVPRGASVSNFSMWINGKEMTGEVVEKQKAREIYNSYKQVRKDPGLLEQTDYRTFELRVFPIAPRAEQHIQITYAQQLDFDHDSATYVYPLATSTRQDARPTTAGKFSFTVDARSAIPIKAMTSPSHEADFSIAKHGDNYQQASLEVSGGNLNRDVVINYTTSRPHTGIDVITSKQGSEDGYYMLTLTAGEELAALSTGMDYVFVMDISGSMNADSKINTGRKSLEAFIHALGKDDRFEVITFNNSANSLFGALKGADDASKKSAEDFLNSQKARGGTVLSPAMTSAYKYIDAGVAGPEPKKGRPLNVVLLSDGLTEQGETAGLIKLIKDRPENTRVFCVGVGNDVNRALLEEIATDSGGLAAFISHEDDFTRQAAAFQRKLVRPVATNLKIDIAGAGIYDVEPQKLGNLYYGTPVRMYGRYKNSGPAKVTVSGSINGQPLSKTVDITLPGEDPANPEIERMWAWQRVDRLQKQSDAAGAGRAEVIPEIVRLGEGYSIVTEYTSFLVLENDGEFQRWKIDRKNALRVTRDRAAQAKVQEELSKLREQNALGPVDKTKLMDVSAAAAPPQNPGQQTASNTPAPNWNPPAQNVPQQNRDQSTGPQSRDISFGGGGAIDPLSGSLIAGLGLTALLAKRRRKQS